MRALPWRLFILLIYIGAVWPVGIAWTQTAEEAEIESKLRDLEQAVQTRLAGNVARARGLIEQAEEASRGALERDASLRPECQKAPIPTEVDVVLAELKSALDTTVSRLKEDRQAYEQRRRQYDAHVASDARKIELYFALRVQYANLLQLRSKGRNLAAIAESYQNVIPEVAVGVAMAACLTRGQPGVSDIAKFLSTALLRLIRDYRDLLYVAAQ